LDQFHGSFGKLLGFWRFHQFWHIIFEVFGSAEGRGTVEGLCDQFGIILRPTIPCFQHLEVNISVMNSNLQTWQHLHLYFASKKGH